MRLTASMIVRNEEAMLGRCLESLKEFDEVIVLDTGSTDHTGDVARMYKNVTYIEKIYQWNDSFCEARNMALTFVTGDWIFIIDADEYLEPGGTQKIRDFIATTKARVIDTPSISEIDQSVHYLPRLFVKAPDIFYRGAIHNHLSVLNQGKLDVFITYGYSPAHEKDPDRALRILKKEVEKNRECSREKFYLAREYWYRRDWITALYWYNEYLKVGKFWAEMAEAHLVKARCLFYLFRGNEARDACLQAIKLNSNFQEALEFMAEMSGPGNRKRWLEFAHTADNNSLLFDRSNVMNAKRVYYCDGMKTFGEKMIQELGYIKYNPDLDIHKNVFFEGLYFEEDYQVFNKHIGYSIVFWNGSDILRLTDNKKLLQYLKKPAIHLCHHTTDLERLLKLGIKAMVYPLFFGKINKYQLSYKQKSSPDVYLTCHPGREQEYGIPLMYELAKVLPNVWFHIYGVNGISEGIFTENVVYHGLVQQDKMDAEISHFQGAIKLLNAEGISQTVLKSCFMGQYPISINKIDGVAYAPDISSMIKHIGNLRNKKEPNIELRMRYLNIYANQWEKIWELCNE